MQTRAISKYVRISPYKLRPYAKAIAGYPVDKAIAWLKTCGLARVKPIEKTVLSAFANAQQHEQTLAKSDMVIKEIRVDQGSTYRYYKPGAMGRACVQRKRLSHIAVVLQKSSAPNKQEV